MEPLRITKVEPDKTDLNAGTFVVRLSRAMTEFEQETLPELITAGLLPAVVRDRGSVTIMNANIEMFEREEVREGLKQIVSEAEALAKTKLSAHNAAEAEKTAAVEEAQRRADGLDWS